MIRSATQTRARGESATMDMALQREKEVDPAYMLIKAPIEKWAEQAYDEGEDRHDIMRRA